MTILVYNLFDLFRLDIVSSDMLNIILIPLCCQLLESHLGRVAWGWSREKLAFSGLKRKREKLRLALK